MKLITLKQALRGKICLVPVEIIDQLLFSVVKARLYAPATAVLTDPYNVFAKSVHSRFWVAPFVHGRFGVLFYVEHLLLREGVAAGMGNGNPCLYAHFPIAAGSARCYSFHFNLFEG